MIVRTGVILFRKRIPLHILTLDRSISAQFLLACQSQNALVHSRSMRTYFGIQESAIVQTLKVCFMLFRKNKTNSGFSVDMYLEFACCAAIPGGGRNKEYAMHLLHMCGGNIHVSFFNLLVNDFAKKNSYRRLC